MKLSALLTNERDRWLELLIEIEKQIAGLEPMEHSSGEKQRYGAISKAGGICLQQKNSPHIFCERRNY